jgi:phosphatidylserine/phosphatidylglycerophosphate/cardiolipin synthase-like enzyme
MNVSVHYTQIQHHIATKIQEAEREIFVAVAWFSNEDIIRELTNAAKGNLDVRTVIGNLPENFRNLSPWDEYIKLGGKLFVFTETLLHHKFCVIDNKMAINGSYNWTYRAQHNEENIMILRMEEGVRADELTLESLRKRHELLCRNGAQRVLTLGDLAYFAAQGHQLQVTESMEDQQESQLRLLFQQRLTESFHQAQALNVKLSEDYLNRMIRDGGGVKFAKRIVHDEMRANEPKSGFMKLVHLSPPRLDLSLEYQILRPEFAPLFTEEEKAYCQKLVGWMEGLNGNK